MSKMRTHEQEIQIEDAIVEFFDFRVSYVDNNAGKTSVRSQRLGRNFRSHIR